jgi:tRNA (guanine-N(7)-)-methyltransferase subunit TRM82
MPKEGPKFAHELLLGHVSMLTCVLTTRDSENRPYIITADRDEHIRVSRGMPQTHVIEAFCLGHGSFVNALCNPRSRPEVLVSGGGDNELFVWDWLAGKLLGTVDLLDHVRGVVPDATKLAVVKLLTYEVEDKCHVAAICERYRFQAFPSYAKERIHANAMDRVPALFFFQLQTDYTLSYKGTVEVRGNPLDITTLGVAGETLLVAVDPAGGDEELLVFEHNETLWGRRGSIQGASKTGEHPGLAREDLVKALYTVESLRKTEFPESEDEAAPGTPEQSLETRPED